MWKLTQFLTRLAGKSTCKLFRSVFFLFCFLLSATDSFGQSSTNVDFIVVGSAYYLNNQTPVVYDTIPTGCLLFWSVIFDSEQRATIYRSESGHIAYVSNGRLVIAGSDGKPMPWFLNSGLQLSTKISVAPDGDYVVFYKTTPNILYKNAFDTINLNIPRGMGSSHFIGALPHVSGNGSYIGRFGDYLLCPVGGNYCVPMYDKQRYNTVTHQYEPAASYLYSTVEGSNWYADKYMLRWAWRSTAFNVTLAGFKGLLNSKWWLTGKFITDSTGITSIGVSGGGGIGDLVGDGSGGDGVSGGNIPPDANDYAGNVPGTVDTPPTNPIGQNGKWVYDPETKLWNWQGDVADNAIDIDPFGTDQPAPQYNTGDLAQESTLRKVEAGIDGLAKENTLQQIRMTLENFQQQQGITPEQLQAMIDNSVVSIVDGQVQYWEGKNLAGKLDSIDASVDAIDSSVDAASDRLYAAQNYANGKIDQIKDATIEIRNTASSIQSQLGLFGPIVSTLKNVRDSIVNAVNCIQIPENPTTDGQETEDFQIGEPDLSSQIDGWLSLDFPLIDIPVAASLPDYEIGVMGWKIPFSYFSAHNGNWWNIIFIRVRMILKWLVYLSATLALCKAMGAGL